MCYNSGTWHNYSQAKLSCEELYQRTKCKTKYNLESQDPLGNNRASLTRLRTFKHLFATLHVRWQFLIATLVITRLLLDEIYHFIELLFDWLMIWCWFLFVCLLIWFDFRFCYSFLTWETDGLELASTIILVLQPNRTLYHFGATVPVSLVLQFDLWDDSSLVSFTWEELFHVPGLWHMIQKFYFFGKFAYVLNE